MANLNFGTSNQTFRQLLGNGLTYKIPLFQRDYSWTADEWEDLWLDIIAMFEENGEPAHYMGYLVLQSSDSKKFGIIDGQQRMITVSTLILAALSNLDRIARENHDASINSKRAEQLRNSYIGYLDPVTLVSKPKLELNRHNNTFYRNYIVPLGKVPQRSVNASNKLLSQSLSWFSDKIKQRFNDDGKELTAFIDQMVDKLFFTVITVTDELNAFKVFETLNARGVRLSATDLLKNYLFSIVCDNDTHDLEIKSMEDRWEQIVSYLGPESFPVYLRTYWNSKYKLIRKSDLFKTVKNSISNKTEAFNLIRNLEENADLYAALQDTGDSRWNDEEKECLGNLKKFNVCQHISLLMAAYRSFYDSSRNDFTRVLNCLCVLSFRYNVICNMQPNAQEAVYNSIAVKISQNKFNTIQEIIAQLKDIYPDDTVFGDIFARKEFDTTNSRNKKIARYILLELEKQKSGNHYDIESDSYSLEHISPQNPTEEVELTDIIDDSFIHRLGNITLIDSSENRIAGNISYSEKKAIYERSRFEITKSIPVHYSEWNIAKIESRQSQMANKAKSIWKISFS